MLSADRRVRLAERQVVRTGRLRCENSPSSPLSEGEDHQEAAAPDRRVRYPQFEVCVERDIGQHEFLPVLLAAPTGDG